MRTNNLNGAIRAAAAVTLLAALLAGCAQRAPESAPPPAAARDAAPAPEAVPGPADAPITPAQPAPDAPPPTEPSAAPAPSAATEPSLDSMRLAAPSNSKMSVAADLRYSFDSPVLPNQPVTLHLAAIPRVAGISLKVSVQQDPGLQLAAGALNVQKTGSSNVYRQQVSLTKLDAAAAQVRVLVTTDVGAGSGFAFFSIPLDDGTNAQKADPVKQR